MRAWWALPQPKLFVTSWITLTPVARFGPRTMGPKLHKSETMMGLPVEDDTLQGNAMQRCFSPQTGLGCR